MMKKNNKIEEFYDGMVHRATQRFKDADSLSLTLMFHLAHTFNHAHNHMSEVSQIGGMSLAGFNVLSLLNQNPEKGMPLSDISQLLLVTRANVTGLIDSLEKKGLVERVNHAHDRRVYLARITKTGQAVHNRHWPHHYQAVRKMTDLLNDSEKKKMIQLLTKLREGIEKLETDKNNGKDL